MYEKSAPPCRNLASSVGIVQRRKEDLRRDAVEAGVGVELGPML
jgi:hypothetical protein